MRGHYQIRDDSGGCPMGSNFGTVHQSIRHYSEGCNYWVKKLQSAQNDDNLVEFTSARSTRFKLGFLTGLFLQRC